MLLPKVGQVMFLYVENSQGGELTEYKTRLVDETDTEFLFDFPINVQTNESSYMAIGKKVKVEYVAKNGVRYNYESSVSKHVKNNNLHLMVMNKPEEAQINQIQRRNYFRIEIDVDLAILKKDHTRKVFRTEDIGGGGISFIAGPQDRFEKGEKLDCWILLPYKNGTNEHANFTAEVVRVNEEERGYKVVMLKYLDILEAERQRIIRFSFAKQIELKEKSINT